MAAAAASYSTPREHVEWIRRERYYIGRDEKNPLAEDIHQAVLYLSEELYSKDVHFLMELVQNAEDNKYADGVTPSLEFLITSKDITATGAKTTLLLFNNEIGFSPSNIDSICRIGKSTKKGNRHLGYIGEKGIGFKSVFLISSKPYIFSNGYQICFNEEPSPECNLGYIVPEWVDESPSLSDIKNLFGPSESLPTTIIILPLKIEKETAVKQQLSNLQPEVLLFLSKIRQLSVKGDSNDSTCNTGCKISISGEDNCQTKRNFNAESYPLHLTAQMGDKGVEEQCCYYMWKQRFPVKPECISKKRTEVDEWVITLAFPFGRRLNRGMRKSGVYAFLPTDMETGFSFIIQADFLLVSSRESLQLNSPWNEGILSCIPSAFMNAFTTLIKGAHEAPSFSIPFLFNFIPVKESHIKLLDPLRQSIKEKIIAERIIPCELNDSQKMFCKPSEIKRLVPSFWNVLIKAQKSGVDILNLHSYGSHIVNAYLDNDDYNKVLGFLGVGYVDLAWYATFIRGSNLTKGMPNDIYVELLHFIAQNWKSCLKDLPLLRFIDANGGVSLLSVSQATNGHRKLCIANDDEIISWLINWNREFVSVSNLYFMPQTVQLSLRVAKAGVMDWLKDSVKLQSLCLYDYASIVIQTLTNSKLVVAFAHFLYHSHMNNYTSHTRINKLLFQLPIVDEYGEVIFEKTRVLVPASMGKWITLIGSNPWRTHKYFVLSTDYLATANFAGNVTCEGQILKFLQKHAKASDVPRVFPPNAVFKTVYSPLTIDNAFLLLEWIRNIRSRGTNYKLPKFFSCIKTGSWLKTSIGYKPPSESFLPSSGWGRLLEVASTLVDIPLIQKEFYGEKIMQYSEELKEIGVRFEFMDASEYIGSHLRTATADSTLTRANVFSLLKLVRYLGEVSLSPGYLIQSTKTARWLKTTVGFRLASESILVDSEWTLASHVSNLPFIDTSFYGEQISDYKSELQLFGVSVGFNKNYKVVVDNLKIPSSCVSADTAIFILECIRNVNIPVDLLAKLSQTKWLNTQLGYQNPGESFLPVLEWECLHQVVSGISVIDEAMYGGRIRSYQAELKKVGVAITVDDFSKAIASRLNLLLEGRLITNKNVLALLSCYRQFIKKEITLTPDLLLFSLGKEWLHTKLGFRSPKASILFSPEWASISAISNLPFIDGNSEFYGYSNEIYGFANELRAFGVVVELKLGAKFVIDNINLPRDPSVINPVSIISLLQCIRNLKENTESLPMEFKKKMKSRWIKTVLGYRSPEESILFDPKWSLQRKDGPFIDDIFYGSELASYISELKEIGVSVDATEACQLLSYHITCHSDITTISRVYLFLNEHKWEVDDAAAEWIWIPSDGGKWVSSNSCILHDKLDLFGSQLFVLDKYYDTKLLQFFSRVFAVRLGPCVDDYCKLWSSWEVSAHPLTVQQCSAFWVFMAKQWNRNTEKLLLGNISQLPVQGNDEVVILSNKQDVFIPDDLLLKELFDKVSGSIFVWYPRVTAPALSRANMNKIYSSIGVQSISVAVEKDEPFRTSGASVRNVDPRSLVSNNGLLSIVLAFLSDTSLDIIATERHRLVKYLLDLEVLEIDEPVTVSYKLKLSSGTILNSKATRMFRWEKDNAKFFLQRDECGTKRKRHNFEYATNFADVIAKGLLSEMPDQIASLAELIRLGYLLDFEEDTIDFLLKTKNLQLFPEDEEFLTSMSSTKNVEKTETGETATVDC